MTSTLTTVHEQAPSTDVKKLQQACVAGSITINSIDELNRLGQILSQSGFFEDCKQASQAVVKVLAGSELGFPAFSSMVGIHIIKGKPALGANLIAAAIKRSGRYDYRVVELNDRTCKIAFYEGKQQIGVSEFTAADAAKAGTQNMGKFPRNMLFARCVSNGVKWFCPDIFLGAPIYTPEELGAVVDEEGSVVELPTPSLPTLSADVQVQTPGVWRNWKSPEDAIAWASTVLPDLSCAELQKLLDELPAVNGKKAPAWVEKVLEMAVTF